MRLWHLVSGLAAAQVLFTAPVAAQGPSLPGNTVSCVYDYLSAEDREIALLLIAREIVDGGGFSKASQNVQAVDRLIEEAHQKCLTRFNWSIARSDTASGFALTSILAEALGQAIESFGYPIGPLGDHFRENRLALSGKRDLTSADKDRLYARLKLSGWDKAREAELGLAALYVETLMLKDRALRQFTAASGTGRQPLRSPKAPARTAGRGKP